MKSRNRRLLTTMLGSLSLLGVLAVAALPAQAGVLDKLSTQDANSGLKGALEQGSNAAVALLGKENGFLNNDKVKIQLPGVLEKARPILQMTGKAGQLDELVVAMNRAAESAVPKAKPLLVNAVKSMTLTDAKNILTGGDTSVTDFFKSKTSAQLAEQFLPSVKAVTDKSGLASKYNQVMGQAQKFGVVSEQEANVEKYVTAKAMDGLFFMIAEEEKKIRQDPIGAGSQAVRKVFELLK